ncbi:hypothetical protein PIB30_048119 [Stylosanthes scabra]|uniref:Uncharacterized protein n=1 Tax=Stylosanthes scabra TaxID=79078 RepID=A0ABU6ZFP4_9FABA|nr:hypothetical protein [Stylosanthes scabra]
MSKKNLQLSYSHIYNNQDRRTCLTPRQRRHFDERSARGVATRLIRDSLYPLKTSFDIVVGNPNRLCREQGRDSSKDELSQELATSSKIPSMGLGSFSQRVNTKDDFGCEKNGGCNLFQDITSGVRSGSGRRERKERKDRNKPRRPLLEPMCTHHMEPCVRIQACATRPIADLGTYAYAYEASMRTHRSIPASINKRAFHHFKEIPLPHLA